MKSKAELIALILKRVETAPDAARLYFTREFLEAQELWFLENVAALCEPQPTPTTHRLNGHAKVAKVQQLRFLNQSPQHDEEE